MDELSELRDLAESRLSEITALSKQVSVLNAEKEAVSEEKKKPPTKEAILDSAVYKGLQTQYSVAAHEINQVCVRVCVCVCVCGVEWAGPLHIITLLNLSSGFFVAKDMFWRG